MQKEWHELDDSARQNLNDSSMRRFLEYKEDLMSLGYKWDDACEILSGFIWDEIEIQSEDNE